MTVNEQKKVSLKEGEGKRHGGEKNRTCGRVDGAPGLRGKYLERTAVFYRLTDGIREIRNPRICEEDF